MIILVLAIFNLIKIIKRKTEFLINDNTVQDGSVKTPYGSKRFKTVQKKKKKFLSY